MTYTELEVDANKLVKEVVKETLNDKIWRHNKAVMLWATHKDYLKFWKDTGINPYKIVNFYECFDNPDAEPILMDENPVDETEEI